MNRIDSAEESELLTVSTANPRFAARILKKFPISRDYIQQVMGIVYLKGLPKEVMDFLHEQKGNIEYHVDKFRKKTLDGPAVEDCYFDPYSHRLVRLTDSSAINLREAGALVGFNC